VPKRSPRLWLQGVWYAQGRPPWPLRFLAGLFGAAVRTRAALYRHGWLTARRLGRPVVVVGNLTVGGSGKTPLVVWLSEQLCSAGRRPGVILRGYGGSAAASGTALRVEPDSDPAVVGDEALLLRVRTAATVAVCRDRVRAAQLLLDAGADVLIADDGLQHLALPRCFELVVVDAERGFGNGYLLPAGPLREPTSRLARIDALVIHGSQPLRQPLPREASPARYAMQLRGQWLRPVASAGRAEAGSAHLALSALAGRRVHAIAGIGNPQRFFEQLRAAGLQPIEHPFADHAQLRPEQLQFADGLPVLMTEKDAVKCRAFGGSNRWYLPVAASFSEADTRALRGALQRALAAFDSHGAREK
jgi:tetraacyldisaccharide 4'-kinase